MFFGSIIGSCFFGIGIVLYLLQQIIGIGQFQQCWWFMFQLCRWQLMWCWFWVLCLKCLVSVLKVFWKFRLLNLVELISLKVWFLLLYQFCQWLLFQLCFFLVCGFFSVMICLIGRLYLLVILLLCWLWFGMVIIVLVLQFISMKLVIYIGIGLLVIGCSVCRLVFMLCFFWVFSLVLDILFCFRLVSSVVSFGLFFVVCSVSGCLVVIDMKVMFIIVFGWVVNMCSGFSMLLLMLCMLNWIFRFLEWLIQLCCMVLIDFGQLFSLFRLFSSFWV